MALSFLIDFRGEVAALSAALIWAIASVIYIGIGRQLSPLVLNFVKGLIAIVLLILTLLLKGGLLPQISLTAVGLLFLSGVVGIGFGDTAYFEALNCLGARRALVLESVAPPLAAVMALVFLQERLAVGAWAGIALTIVGVTWVIIERTQGTLQPQSHRWRGTAFGLLAALGQASGAVLSRAALAGTTIDPLWSSLIRLVAGGLVLVIWLLLQRRTVQDLKPLRSPRFLLLLTVTAFASTYLAIWLQQISLKYTAAGIAQALSATSPLFVIPLAIALGEKVSLRAIVGVLVAIIGIWLLFS
ncbi:DMT family transporter [Stenomitos frigidus]|uniref:EamA family transporter n=1 Tax=Stenomitos frigidus ULC18 TaxID=2107698 RepID=A0A2T1DY06_9CYAN|nr:DMT family transporter [Stenomitos frigidus]PSB25321.1 EamA family transporter [Stenomitos frigidus ULC18]